MDQPGINVVVHFLGMDLVVKGRYLTFTVWLKCPWKTKNHLRSFSGTLKDGPEFLGKKLINAKQLLYIKHGWCQLIPAMAGKVLEPQNQGRNAQVFAAFVCYLYFSSLYLTYVHEYCFAFENKLFFKTNFLKELWIYGFNGKHLGFSMTFEGHRSLPNICIWKRHLQNNQLKCYWRESFYL